VRGPGKRHDEDRRRERRYAGVRQNQPKHGGGERDHKHDEARAGEVQDCEDERGSAEELQFVQFNDDLPQAADRARQPLGTGKLDRGGLDHQKAKIERVAERGEADQQEKIGLARCRNIEAHAGG